MEIYCWAPRATEMVAKLCTHNRFCRSLQFPKNKGLGNTVEIAILVERIISPCNSQFTQ